MTGVNRMDQETLELLGFPQLIELIQAYARTEPGLQEVGRIEPFWDSAVHQVSIKVLEEYIRCRHNNQPVHLPELNSPAPILDRLAVQGVVLEPSELLELGTLAGLCSELRNRLGKDVGPHLTAIFGELPDLQGFATKISDSIAPEGEVRDTADPELQRTRRNISKARQRAQEHLRSYLSGASSKFLIAEPFVTQRNNRNVIPVRAEYQRAVAGVVHGTSASGATVFVEPLGAVELNNECARLEDRERVIVLRILARLTEGARGFVTELRKAVDALAQADLLEAKARFMEAYKCVLPDCSSGARLLLREARHPLLEHTIGVDRTVPISLELSAEKNVLVISGPNAGGKTVALKTTGLLSIMALAGLPVPAVEASVPRFKQVLADIGDSQSIAESLSTFSAHILRIKRMLEHSEYPSLILLDEVGTGTDPVYGASLGMAVIDYFCREKAFIVATTHHRSLKQYAALNAAAENASVELDPFSLRPSYRLIRGSVGESSAFEIAEQLGLPAWLLEEARGLLDSKQLQVEAYLEELRKDSRTLEEARWETEQERLRLTEKVAELERDFRKREEERQKSLERVLEGCATEFRRDAARYLKSLQDRFESAKVKRQAAFQEAALKEEFRRRAKAASSNVGKEEDSQAPDLPRPGDWVYDSFFKKKGQVLEIEEETVVILAEGKRLKTLLNRINRIGKAEVTRHPAANVTVEVVEDSDPELNLIGRTVEEALSATDKFLDRAFVSQLREIRLIHGYGTGRLKNALAGFLNEHEHVLSHQVDGGVTTVVLKD